MTVYVDSPVFARRTSKRPRKFYAHMIADSLEELHAFAAKIGVKRHFLHRASILHYDINSDQHAIAIQNGAQQISSAALVGIGKSKSIRGI